MSRLFGNITYRISQHAFQTNVVTGTYHKGVDLAPNPRECDIHVHTEGEVVKIVSDHNYTDTTGSSYGNYIKVKHPNGYYTLYAHLKPNSIKVNVGDFISQGEIIATTGQTGRATAIHLHFEVFNPDNEKINPEPFLESDLPNMVSLVEDNKINKEYKIGDKVLVLDGFLTADSYGGGAHTGIYNGRTNPDDDTNYKIITDIINDGRPRPVHLRRTNAQGGAPMGWASYEQITKNF